jgi:hypothetical protein
MMQLTAIEKQRPPPRAYFNPQHRIVKQTAKARRFQITKTHPTGHGFAPTWIGQPFQNHIKPAGLRSAGSAATYKHPYLPVA